MCVVCVCVSVCVFLCVCVQALAALFVCVCLVCGENLVTQCLEVFELKHSYALTHTRTQTLAHT